MNTPVIFFVFNRPTQTGIVLDQILKAQPSKLYIFADGPRTKGDVENIKSVRALIDAKLTNPKIKVFRDYSKINRGLTKSITRGLDFVFAKESYAVILEDDCRPDSSFFAYAEELLKKYQNNNKILSISGHSSGFQSQFSYSFSKFPQCWGWATWSRAWKLYNLHITDPKYEKLIMNKVDNIPEKLFWKSVLKLIRDNKIKTWDYQWTFAHLINNGLAVTPTINLVQNIGFGADATNTRFATSHVQKVSSIKFPLIHPTGIEQNTTLDKKILRSNYLSPIPVLGLIKRYFWG